LSYRGVEFVLSISNSTAGKKAMNNGIKLTTNTA